MSNSLRLQLLIALMNFEDKVAEVFDFTFFNLTSTLTQCNLKIKDKGYFGRMNVLFEKKK